MGTSITFDTDCCYGKCNDADGPGCPVFNNMMDVLRRYGCDMTDSTMEGLGTHERSFTYIQPIKNKGEEGAVILSMKKEGSIKEDATKCMVRIGIAMHEGSTLHEDLPEAALNAYRDLRKSAESEGTL